MSVTDLWFESAKKGDVDELRRLAAKPDIPSVDIQDQHYRTALFVAASRGHGACVEELLRRGADPNKLSLHGTAAHAAASANHKECLVLLLAYGAGLGATNLEGQTVLRLIKKHVIEKVAQIIDEADQMLVKETKRDAFKNSLGTGHSEETGQQACVSGIPCPLPLVAPFEVEQADGAVYAQGPFSVYVKGKMRYSRVMVKKARTDVAEETQFKLFENEAMVLSQLRHPQILTVLAACCGPSTSDKCLILEPVERGFLSKLLYEDREPLDEETILEIGRDLACAMNYVHQMGAIHCCIASHNVVITESYRAKICNFEFARFVANGRSSGPISHHKELYQWMAPEQLMGKRADTSCDVYSFGVTIMECVTMKRPFADIKTITQVKYSVQDPRIKKIPRKWSRIVIVLIKETLAREADRPTFEQIYEWLDGTITCRYVNPRPTSIMEERLPSIFLGRKSKSQ